MTVVTMYEQRKVDNAFITIYEMVAQLAPGAVNPFVCEARELSKNPRNDRVLLRYDKPNGVYTYSYVNGKRVLLTYDQLLEIPQSDYSDTTEIDGLLATMKASSKKEAIHENG